MKKLSIVGVLVSLVLSGFALTKDSAPVVGSVSSPDISSRYFSVGSVREWRGKTTTLNTASTTLCAVQAPNATSTLASGSGIRLDVSSTTASVVVLAKASTQYATTTVLGIANVAAGAQASIVATSTADSWVFAPNNWFVVSAQGGVGTFSPSGLCEARWIEL